jgi:hypothetical protein
LATPAALARLWTPPKPGGRGLWNVDEGLKLAVCLTTKPKNYMAFPNILFRIS